MKQMVFRGLCVLGLFVADQPAPARVVRVQVRSRSDLADGKAFGLAGPYEKLSGTIFFAVPPDDPHDRAIVDLARAPRNAAGEVEFSADFVVKPHAAARGAQPRRKGHPRADDRARGSVDPETQEDLGDGFLMRRGVTVAWVGWQWDLRESPGLLRLRAPAAQEKGMPILGRRIDRRNELSGGGARELKERPHRARCAARAAA